MLSPQRWRPVHRKRAHENLKPRSRFEHPGGPGEGGASSGGGSLGSQSVDLSSRFAGTGVASGGQQGLAGRSSSRGGGGVGNPPIPVPDEFKYGSGRGAALQPLMQRPAPIEVRNPPRGFHSGGSRPGSRQASASPRGGAPPVGPHGALSTPAGLAGGYADAFGSGGASGLGGGMGVRQVHNPQVGLRPPQTPPQGFSRNLAPPSMKDKEDQQILDDFQILKLDPSP